MHYRFAIQKDDPPIWQWTSTALGSLNVVVQWLLYYRAYPRDHLCIFYSASREGLPEQLQRENQGLSSTSVPATQFMRETRTMPSGAAGHATELSPRGGRGTAQPLDLDGGSRHPLDKRREKLERGAGGDHDLPYEFRLPTSTPQVLAWVNLMRRVRQGDLRSETVAREAGIRSGDGDALAA